MKISLDVQVMSSSGGAAIDTHVIARKDKYILKIYLLTSLSFNSVLNSLLLYNTVCQCL
jgi:hypothetical protein